MRFDKTRAEEVPPPLCSDRSAACQQAGLDKAPALWQGELDELHARLQAFVVRGQVGLDSSHGCPLLSTVYARP